MNTRKIKTPGINPSSYLIHPATLKFIKKNQNKQPIKTNTSNKNVMLIPKISFSYQEILSAYQIKYIQDLNDNINNFGKLTKIRLINLYFKYNKNIKHYQETDIPNIYTFLTDEFNLSSQEIYNNLTLLKDKLFQDIFY
ncbi:hypothetical protein crov488 [Cafeteria roenbergensis virus]|uniref:Uncharacterized protein n=1 Tax=Cafeteria roenbergensis virus (strain BV-PW1) TaxID=693272 RepID=E3T5Q9_CROVB|nr:hypothetical protein crov488 [Cafeteria roenbergensis virus BV-PW1]ADO67522.1 hypothetical protein crov488 [Cafeteria roenbergensis virus BV-PW1]